MIRLGLFSLIPLLLNSVAFANERPNIVFISAVDLLSTFCEVAGATLPKSYSPDGVSQLAALTGNGKAVREKPLFWKIGARWPPDERQPYHWVSYAIVDQNWKLLANKDASYVELYDIIADPYEKNDLKEEKPDVVKLLMDKIDAWKGTLPAKPTGNVFSIERKR